MTVRSSYRTQLAPHFFAFAMRSPGKLPRAFVTAMYMYVCIYIVID